MQDLRTENKGQILAVKDLPTLPRVLQEVSRLVEDESSSPEQIAKVISKDQVLSAKVLRMVNSPIYGFPRRINTVQHALVLLGLNVIKGLIISTSVFDVMTKSMVGLWEHSLGCALCCSSLAFEAGFKDPEEYAVTGLLHDIGKVVLAVQLPEAKAEIEQKVANEDLSYLEAEKKELGF
ncbi:MAG: HDOD domain-containing protein, partial [Desulfohalobiaceae bacterium]